MIAMETKPSAAVGSGLRIIWLDGDNAPQTWTPLPAPGRDATLALAELQRCWPGLTLVAMAPLDADGTPEPAVASPRLTGRQRQVLRLLCEGHANKAIGHAMAISEKTVKAHVTSVLRALNVSSRTQAIAAARRADLFAGAPARGPRGRQAGALS